MLRRRVIACVVLLIALGGCASAPAPRNIQKSRGYTTDQETMWNNVVRYLASQNYPVKTMEKASGVIFIERVRVDKRYADCGNPGLAVVVSTNASVNVLVASGTQGTTVTVNTSYSQIRQFDRNVWTVQCESTGMLERDILHAI